MRRGKCIAEIERECEYRRKEERVIVVDGRCSWRQKLIHLEKEELGVLVEWSN